MSVPDFIRKPARAGLRLSLKIVNSAADLFNKRDKLPASIRRVVLFAPFSGLGNLILWAPALTSLKNRWPKCEVTLVGPKGDIAEPLIESGLIHKVLPFRKISHSSFKLRTVFVLDNVRPIMPDAALCTFLEPPRTASWWAFLTEAPIRVGFGGAEETILLTDRLTVDKTSHEIVRNMKVVERLGANPEPPPLKIALKSDDIEWADDFIAEQRLTSPFVAMHPGSAPGKRERRKRWPASRFAEVAKKLADRGIKSLVIEGPADRDDVREIAVNAEESVIVVKERRIGKVAALLSRSAVTLANDSGLMHLASAVGVPVVALFGPTDPVKNRPPPDRSTVLIKPCERAPCYLEQTVPCETSGPTCLLEISSDEAVAAIMEWLDKITS